ncbi:hypothetical protein PoB_004504200 [Plakobranchus ocellatus]|uniref:Uncharacterized protein n=1 Tax=Plakobranchus ocellatus TaxID=259542 RepID=A0AAV4BGZ2_9GAST|nr:hypothetical protein PoB_004504200 [Plakobranchus ocellatus]
MTRCMYKHKHMIYMYVRASRSVHVWTGPERNRRAYDRSREGPVLGQSWRALERELRFRENSLSAAHYTMPAVSLGGFQPVDIAFPRK